MNITEVIILISSFKTKTSIVILKFKIYRGTRIRTQVKAGETGLHCQEVRKESKAIHTSSVWMIDPFLPKAGYLLL